jgi:hypothetical protein
LIHNKLLYGTPLVFRILNLCYPAGYGDQPVWKSSETAPATAAEPDPVTPESLRELRKAVSGHNPRQGNRLARCARQLTISSILRSCAIEPECCGNVICCMHPCRHAKIWGRYGVRNKKTGDENGLQHHSDRSLSRFLRCVGSILLFWLREEDVRRATETVNVRAGQRRTFPGPPSRSRCVNR